MTSMSRSSTSTSFISSRRSSLSGSFSTISDQVLLEAQLHVEFARTGSAGVSLPSMPAVVVDTPNPLALSAEFVYNFFEPSELQLRSPTGSPQDLPQNINVEKLRLLPRYVALNWSAVNQESSLMSPVSAMALNEVSIAANKDKIISENDIAVSKLFVDYSQQELDFVSNTRAVLGRLNTELSRLAPQASGQGDIKPTIQTAIAGLYNSTPEEVDQEFISKYMSYGSSEVMVGSKRLNSPVLNEPLEAVYQNEDIGISVTIGNAAAGVILSSLYCADPLSDKSSTAADQVAKSIQFQTTLSSVRPRFNLSQYSIGAAIVNNIVSYEQLDDVTPQDVSPLPPLSFKSVGYIIEKRRSTVGTSDQTNPTLSLGEPEMFFVEDPSIAQFYDQNVAYNQTYYYSVKSVTAFRACVTDKSTGQNFAVVFLVASEPARTFVQCVDIEPPAPPTDFFVSMDLGSGKPMLTWNFPVDTRRHVKYFQVFRRKNRGQFRPIQLPFELVAMYDFNNLTGAQGVVYDKLYDPTFFKFLLPGTENAIAKSSVIDMASSRGNTQQLTTTSYVDQEFVRGEYYIYAVVAVDAHGQSSCYSNQIGVVFNREKNTIERVTISPPGAPKTYPNLLVDKQVFVDTIKNDGYSQMTVVFNPDFMDLKNIRGENLSLIKTQESGGEYIIKLINLDLQKDQTVKFHVLDTRERG